MNPQILVPIAVAVAVVATFLLLWRRPRRAAITVPQAAESARQALGSIHRILAPTIGIDYSERGIELACRVGESQRAAIELLYVIVVPRSLPIGTPMPDEEAKARMALARGESIVRSHGLACSTSVERARSADEGIIRHAKSPQVDVIVIGIRSTYGGGEVPIGRTIDVLLRDAPCEVIIDKLPIID